MAGRKEPIEQESQKPPLTASYFDTMQRLPCCTDSPDVRHDNIRCAAASGHCSEPAHPTACCRSLSGFLETHLGEGIIHWRNMLMGPCRNDGHTHRKMELAPRSQLRTEQRRKNDVGPNKEWLVFHENGPQTQKGDE